RAAADALFTWTQRCLMETPTRCTPLLCADLNDGLGMVKHEAGVFSPLSEAIGLVEPALEHESGTAWRQLCEEWGFATVNTFFEGYTFSGPTGARSRPDVIALPRELVPSAEDCKPLYTIGDRLQAIRARGRRGRTPLGVSVRITPVQPEIIPRAARAQWDMDACMLALKRHQGKLEFLTELEYKCEDMVRPPLDEEQDPDEAWDELAEVVRETGLAHFGLKERDAREMEEATDQRKKLLQERADIRRRHVIDGEMGASTDVELGRCVQELKDATRRPRALQRQRRRRLRAARCEALAEAERAGDAATVWRLAHLLGERGLGARRRVHCAPRLERAAAARRKLLKSPGRLGGYAATELDARPYLEQLRPPPARCCSVLDAEEAALEDLGELEERMRRRTQPRRAAPPRSAPVPAWRMRSAPPIAARHGDGRRLQGGAPEHEGLRERMLHCLALARVFKTAPPAWSRSRAADIGRIIHVMRPAGKGYASALAARAQKAKAAPNDFGFAPRRSRDGALAVTSAVAERAAHYGLTALTSFKDLSKAFQCPSVRDMAQGLESMARAEDHPIVARRVFDYHCEVETAEGVLRMKTNQCVLIGDSIGPPLFLWVFTPVATEWAIADSDRPDAQLLEAKSVVAGTVLDLSLAKFAGDLCSASDELLDRLLEPRGSQQNIPNQYAMCAFRGEGARAKTRAFFAGRLGARCNCSAVARNLGPMLRYQGGLATEIRERYQRRTMPAQVVRQLLQMADIETELRAARPRFVKCTTRHPADHEVELTALFGQLPFVLQPVLEEGGRLGEGASALARLLVDDAKLLLRASEREDLLEAWDSRPLLLLEGALRDEVIQLDLRVLRVRGWAAQCPPSREVPVAVRHRWWTLHGDHFRPAREPPGLIDIGDFEFACQEPCAEGSRGAAFCSERALLWHKISFHKYRA
ncbi:unnamed protein product, partial [Prorocentrum cordatum]